jgi:hypothetical protein
LNGTPLLFDLAVTAMVFRSGVEPACVVVQIQAPGSVPDDRRERA